MEDDTHDFPQTLQQNLNNGSAIPSINIEEQDYPVKKVSVTCRYNKTAGGFTVSVTVGGKAFGSPQTLNENTTTTFEFEGEDTTGSIVVSFTNNCTGSKQQGTCWCSNVQLTEGASAAPAFTITPATNDENMGTVSISGSVITGSPKAGYRYADPAYTVSPENSATVSQEGNKFTVTPSANTTVTINFEEKPSATITFVNAGTPAPTTTGYHVGDSYTLPSTNNFTPCNGKTFMGWSTVTVNDVDTKPVSNFYEPGAEVTLAASQTFYAVFATKQQVSKSFTMTISPSDFVSSSYGDNNNEKTSTATASDESTTSVKWTSYQVMLQASAMQWQKSAGYIYNSTDLGSITSLTVNSTDGSFTTYYGTSEQPDKDTEVGTGNGYFMIEVGAATGKTSSVEVAFTKTLDVYSEYTTSCCTKYTISIADGITNGTVSADLAKACEGTTVTITFTPNPAYHLDAWTVNSVAQDVNANTFSMPEGNVTVSATFEHDACTQLATPANVIDIVDITSAMLGWDAVEHADKYTVYIYDNSDIEIEHGDVNTNEYTVDATLNANTTYKYTIQAVSNTPAIYCESNLHNGTFTTENYPAATLTLSENGATHEFDDGEEHVMKDEVTLPSSVSKGVDGKVFVGWDANASCTSAPTYAKGAKYTLNDESQTLYAVYATKTGEDNSISITSSTENFPDAYGDANTFTEYTLEGKKFKIQQAYVNSGKLQWRAAGNASGTGTMYNSEALAGLTAVVLTYDGSDSNKNFTVIAGSSANPTGDAITPSIDGNTYTFDCSGNSYFVMANGEYAGYLNAITINTSASYSGYVTTGSYTPTAIDNTEVEGKAVKLLRNGILLIEKNGHTYNAMGQLVK